MSGGSVKSRAMSLAGPELQHDVDVSDVIHQRSPSVGHVHGQSEAGEEEQGRGHEPFGPARLYQSRERDKRQKVDHSPVGRRMGVTKTSTKATDAIAKQRKVELYTYIYCFICLKHRQKLLQMCNTRQITMSVPFYMYI